MRWKSLQLIPAIPCMMLLLGSCKDDRSIDRFGRGFLLSLLAVFSAFFSSASDNNYQEGLKYLALPRYDSAYACFKKASIEAASADSFSLQYVRCLIRLGQLESFFSENRPAFRDLKRAAALLENRFPGRKDLLADCYDQLGKAFEDVDDIESAHRYYKAALGLKISLYGEEDARTGYSYIKITKYYSFIRDQDSANYFSAKALAICTKDTAHQSLINMGEVMVGYAYELKNSKPPDFLNHGPLYAEVRDFYRRSIGFLHKRFKFPTIEEARMYQGWANSYADYLVSYFEHFPEKAMLHYRLADSLYKRSLALKKQLLGERNPQVATTYYTLALLNHDRPGPGQLLLALDYYQKAIEALTIDYTSVGRFDLPPLDRIRFPYYLNVLVTNKVRTMEVLYKKTGDTAYARIIHDHNRYRLRLWDLIIRNFESTETARAIAMWNGTPFESAVASAYRMFELSGDSSFIREVFPIAERGRNNEFLESAVRSGRYLSQFDAEGFPLVIGIERLQRHLRKDGSVFLELLPSLSNDHQQGVAIVVMPDSYRVVFLNEMKFIDSLVTGLHASMYASDISGYEDYGYELFQELIGKPIGRIPSKLVIAATGDFASIPFDALPITTTGAMDFRKLDYLMEHSVLSYALSATEHIRLAEIHPVDAGSLVAFSPGFVDLPDLPFSHRTLDQMMADYKGVFFAGKKATKQAFMDQAQEATILHVMSHAETDLLQSERSALYFSGQGDDKLLLGELYAMHIPAELAVLSACESAKGEKVYAEGLRSFSRAFFYAGTKSTVSTLWKVDEQSTSSIIERFFRHLSDGSDKAIALQRAKLEYLADCRSPESGNPIYWAGLVLTGSERPVTLEKRVFPRWFWWALVPAGISIAVAISLIRRRKRG